MTTRNEKNHKLLWVLLLLVAGGGDDGNRKWPAVSELRIWNGVARSVTDSGVFVQGPCGSNMSPKYAGLTGT